MATATTTARAEYMLGDAEEERRRLVAQAALLDAEARALLERLDIPVGGDVIDIGCGPIGILPLLSDRVGPHGQVTGFDRHGDMLLLYPPQQVQTVHDAFNAGDVVERVQRDVST